MGLCKYQDILGIPREGIHSYRVFDVPIVDYLLTFFLTIGISFIPSIKTFIPNLLTRLLLVFSVLMIVAGLLHTLFCVKSNLSF